MKKIISLFIALILLFANTPVLANSQVAAGAADQYINSKYFEEITPAQADKMYANGENFNLMFYSQNCSNCQSIKPYIEELINTNKIKLYSVDGSKRVGGLRFMWEKFDYKIVYPVIMANKGKDNLAGIQGATNKDLVKKILLEGQQTKTEPKAGNVGENEKATVQEGLFIGKYGINQVFDVQRSPAYPEKNKNFNVSGFIAPFDASQGRSKKADWGTNKDNYLSFEFVGLYNDIASPTAAMKTAKTKYANKGNPPVMALKLYAKDGKFIKNISTMGFVWGLSDEGFLFTAYDKNDDLGYFITNKKGYSYGGKLTVVPKTGLVEKMDDLVDYIAALDTLKSGELRVDTTPAPTITTPPAPITTPSAKVENGQGLTLDGVSIAIGETVEQVEKKLGKPNRIDPSPYSFKWYVYNSDYKKFIMVGIGNGVVQGLYTNAKGFSTKYLNYGDVSSKVIKEIDGNVTWNFYIDKHAQSTVYACLVGHNVSIKQSTMLTEEVILAQEKEIFDCTNTFRVNYGIAPLLWDETAATAAKLHSKDMADLNYFSHTNKKDEGPWTRYKNQGGVASGVGENIAAGNALGIMAFNAWVNSLGHRENMLRLMYTHLGVGSGQNKTSKYMHYSTQLFLKK